MQQVPVEIVEQIIANLSDKDLITRSQVCRVWWQIVRQEAYKRWKQYACEIGKAFWERGDLDKKYKQGKIDWLTHVETAKCTHCREEKFTDMQVSIMRLMLRYRMIIDPSEREFAEASVIEYQWGFKDASLWKLDWEWEETDW